MTPVEVKAMKVGELRAALEARELPAKGLKAALVKRLNAAIAAEADAAPAVEEAATPAPEAEAEAEAVAEEPAAAAAAPAVEEETAAPPTQDEPVSSPQNPTPLPKTTPSEEPKGRKKKKRKKKKKYNEPVKLGESLDDVAASQTVDDPKNNITIEYVTETAFAVDTTDPAMAEFASILERFKAPDPEDEEKEKEKENENEDGNAAAVLKKAEWGDSDNEDDDDEADDSVLSKTAYKKLHRLSVAELKQLVDRPDVIEVHDVTAADPKLLVLLKATRNTVPVPKHWSQKRKYLQNKRGIEKPPFELPKFIVDTGITEMREALQEKEDRMGLRGKLREKTRPKMGKIDIDYQKLHDAFFRFQTKPKHMSGHGDLYYEGKEYETKVTNKKPGELSDELRNALGMPTTEEALANPIPPPWLINSQRYGPPPSYPNLKIPGLNAPLPQGANWGYRGGSDGWGKVPVDEFGEPLYGDVFTASNTEMEQLQTEMQPTSTELWGQLESEESEEESSEEEDSDANSEDGEGDSQAGTITPSGYTSETPSGVTSVDTGIETPDALELRKRRIESDMDDNGEKQTLYKVIAQKDAGSAVAQGMMGSSHVYDVAGATGAKLKQGKKGPIGSGLEVAMDDPEALANMDQDALKAKYEAAEEEKAKGKDDFSDMVADHRAQTAKKRKAGGKKDDKGSKKFKF